MQDAEQFLKACATRYDEEISKDYFIYHAFQYEFCLKADNRKQFVVVKEWLEHEHAFGHTFGKESAQQQKDNKDDFPTALRKMCAWYGESYPAFRDTQPLTFARCYFYLPVALSFVHEAHALWKKLHSTPPPAYDTQHDFWRELLAVVQDKCPQALLLVAWLHWRYGERQAPVIAAENLPPNPFVERRTFGMRRGNERRERGTRRESSTRRAGADRKAGVRGTERMPRQGAHSRTERRGEPAGEKRTRQRGVQTAASASRRDDRARERAGNRRPPRRERNDSRAVAELTDAMTSEIRNAVALLQDNDGHSGVTLKPANSYYRRLQHKMVANMGFTSISVGDDRESRAVKIVRDA